ncbi:tetratricopeptide repeat protein [Chitinimonas sp.]|uniref:tetratricopeptide repeat protein n=1 Tax=Chitinimonas sp. TaxID=1934313 RepID=UPI0035B4F9E5
MSDPAAESQQTSLTLEQMLGLIALRHSEGEYANVEMLCQKILEKYPGHPNALYFRGLAAAAQGAWALAQQCLEALSDIDGVADMSRDALAGVYAAQQSWQSLVHLADTVLSHTPDNAKAYYWRGLAARGMGDVAAARNDLRRAVALVPGFVEARFEYGNLLLVENDAAAITQYERLLELAPTRADVMNNLGLSYSMQSKADKAEAAFRRALSVQPDYAEAKANLAAILLQSGRSDEAGRLFAEVLAQAPHLADAVADLQSRIAAQTVTGGAQ